MGDKHALVFPDPLKLAIDRELKTLNASFDRPAEIAAAIMKLSDFYVKHPEKSSPWTEVWCQIAYLAYYMPLNWWRLMTAVDRGRQVGFFEGLDSYVDFGSGLGSASFAFEALGIKYPAGAQCIERSSEAIALHRSLCGAGSQDLRWTHKAPTVWPSSQRVLGIFSYSLTELSVLPSWTENCAALMVVEPATQDDGRRLMSLRDKLLKEDWYAWAPCTHQSACPLLAESARDWCHDRCQWTQPEWLKQLEKHMPIKNGTLPFSYLMLRRDAPKLDGKNNLARITGDLQEFKGFAKQLVCRSSAREFIAWQRREFKRDYPNVPRGNLVRVSAELPRKGNEIRASKESDITSVQV